MSHVEDIAIQIHDLAALRAAAEELGLIWRENQTTYAWWGHHVGDYPLPTGFTAADLGKCQHALHLPGCNYEIGVVKSPNHAGYTLLYDFYGQGRKLKQTFGPGLGRLTQHYGMALATKQAHAKGYAVTRHTLPSGAIKLKVHV